MAQSSRREKPVSTATQCVDYHQELGWALLLIIFYTKLSDESQVLFFETLKEPSSDFHGLRGSLFELTLAY